jgi:cytochrome c oxidase subunit IV
MSPRNPPIASPMLYVVVWVALLLLLLLNWGLAQLNLGPFNLVATLAIPFVQMMLMLLFLMHVRYNTPLLRVFVAAGFIWLCIMIDLTLSDYLTRGSVPGTLHKSWVHGAWPGPREAPALGLPGASQPPPPPPEK